MKFKDKLDAQSFLLEVGNTTKASSVTEAYEPTEEEMKSFISQRGSLSKHIKNRRKSAKQKASWRKNRHKIMRGIKSFHKSTDGKRFHRKLGRFLATRITRDKRPSHKSESFSDIFESLNALTSLKQHLIVELGYYHRVYERIEVEEMILENALQMLSEIENKVVNGYNLTEDELAMLFDMVNQDTLLDELSKLTGEAFENLKKWCEDITNDLENSGISQDSEKFIEELIKNLILSARETKHDV
jgi:hypothetical protein